MRPREGRETSEQELFRSRLDQIIDLKHALVKLGQAIDRQAGSDQAPALRPSHQFKRANRSLRKLKTYLGRVIRDIERRIVGNEELREAFVRPLPFRAYL